MNRISLAAAIVTAALAGSAMAQTPAPLTDLGPGLAGEYYAAANSGGPVVLVLGGSEGGLRGSGPIARALNEEGFGALALAYFDAPGTPKLLQEAPLETFTLAIDWLEGRPETKGRRIGLVGASKGGEAALLVASRDRRVCAVVAGVPSSVAWAGINPANYAEVKSSWSLGGKPVPFAALDFSKPPAGGVRTFYENGLPKAPPEAVIPVEKIAGPVLLISGRADRLWPSTPMADAVIARLDATKFRYPHTHLAYDDAGHASFGKPVADLARFTPALLNQLGGTAEGNQAARQDSWPKTIAFLKDALAGKGCAPLKK